jgi:hypothetical protein
MLSMAGIAGAAALALASPAVSPPPAPGAWHQLGAGTALRFCPDEVVPGTARAAPGTCRSRYGVAVAKSISRLSGCGGATPVHVIAAIVFVEAMPL